MTNRSRKALIISIKLLVAGALMAWVLLGAHWSDFVRGRDGKTTYSVIEGPLDDGGFLVRQGAPWSGRRRTVAAEELQPVEQADSPKGDVQYLRPGFLTSISRIHPWLLVAAMAGWLAALLVTAVRWWMLLRLQRIRIPLWESVRLMFLGHFFNHVVPGTVGGDLVKAYYAAKHTDAKASVWMSVLVDRILGLAALTVVAACALCVALGTGLGKWADPMIRRSTWVVIGVVISIILALAIVLSARLRKVLHLQKLYRHLPFASAIASFGRAARLYGKRRRAVAQVALITLIAPVLIILSLAVVGRSINLPVQWHSYFLYIPLIYIIGSVPLTPGGVGLIESLYLVFLAAEANPSEILAFALLARLIPVAWTLPGMIVAITGPKLPRAQMMQAELGI